MVIRDFAIITLTNLNKVILCLQKIKRENLGKNQDNLNNFLVKNYE